MLSMKTCREISRLTSESRYRRLAAGERLGLTLHRLLCRPCRRFARQMQMLDQSIAAWRERERDATIR